MGDMMEQAMNSESVRPGDRSPCRRGLPRLVGVRPAARVRAGLDGAPPAGWPLRRTRQIVVSRRPSKQMSNFGSFFAAERPRRRPDGGSASPVPRVAESS